MNSAPLRMLQPQKAWRFRTLEKASKTVQKWFANAHEDLRVAEVLYNLDPEKYLRTIPYHSEQAAEKSIKGYLAYKKIKFAKVHDIGKLASLILPLNPELSDLLQEADELTDYAVQFRYPDATVKREPTIKDAKSALNIAKRVFDKMSSLIPFEGSWDI